MRKSLLQYPFRRYGGIQLDLELYKMVNKEKFLGFGLSVCPMPMGSFRLKGQHSRHMARATKDDRRFRDDIFEAMDEGVSAVLEKVHKEIGIGSVAWCWNEEMFE